MLKLYVSLEAPKSRILDYTWTSLFSNNDLENLKGYESYFSDLSKSIQITINTLISNLSGHLQVNESLNERFVSLTNKISFAQPDDSATFVTQVYTGEDQDWENSAVIINPFLLSLNTKEDIISILIGLFVDALNLNSEEKIFIPEELTMQIDSARERANKQLEAINILFGETTIKNDVFLKFVEADHNNTLRNLISLIYDQSFVLPDFDKDLLIDEGYTAFADLLPIVFQRLNYSTNINMWHRTVESVAAARSRIAA